MENFVEPFIYTPNGRLSHKTYIKEARVCSAVQRWYKYNNMFKIYTGK